MPARKKKSGDEPNEAFSSNGAIENEGDEITFMEDTSDRALPISAAPTDSRYYTDAQK